MGRRLLHSTWVCIAVAFWIALAVPHPAVAASLEPVAMAIDAAEAEVDASGEGAEEGSASAAGFAHDATATRRAHVSGFGLPKLEPDESGTGTRSPPLS